ncbi:MAG: cyclopropane-fatty-acyl-phospholipid synthase family protein [Ornithinimicrobium sp.]
MSVAEVLEPVVRTALKASARVRIECWDGSVLGPSDGLLRIRFVRRRALRWLLWSPNELGFARAYVAGDLEIEGDIVAAISGLDAFADAEHGLGVQVDAAAKVAIARAVTRLGVVGPPPRPPAEETRLSRWRRHTPGRDARAISHHYDVGNDFYSMVLGPSMVYSCAYFEQPPSSGYTLQDAQRAKLDLVADKLSLGPGQRLLDVGCGWGGFVIHAAREYGVHATGITLSSQQAAWAREQVRAEGLQDLVEIRVQDYREVADGPYDAIASIGMAEHVGLAQLSGYASELHALLAPGGRLLNHAISRRPGPPNRPKEERRSFVYRYVFPDGELEPLATMIDALENAGFEVRDVQALREHYALTLREWVANLEREWDRAVDSGGVGRTRVWWLYMAASALQFEFNRIGVNQVLAIKPAQGGVSGMPLTRSELLGTHQKRCEEGPMLADG